MSQLRDVELPSWIRKAEEPMKKLKGYLIIEAIVDGWEEGYENHQEHQEYTMDW